MRILDENNIEIFDPDLNLGHLEIDKIFVAHHPAVEAVEEQWHYEVICVYPNGGKDVEKVIDVAGVEAEDAWDEYEDVYRYIPYTEEEILEREKPTRLDRIEAQLLWVALMTDNLLEVEE